MDTKKPYSDNDNLLPMLTLYSYRKDVALGLPVLGPQAQVPRPGQRTLNLLDYRRKRERQATAELASAAFLKGLIDECRSTVRDLIEAADTPEKRRAVLPEVERLNELAEKAGSQLEAMSG